MSRLAKQKHSYSYMALNLGLLSFEILVWTFDIRRGLVGIGTIRITRWALEGGLSRNRMLNDVCQRATQDTGHRHQLHASSNTVLFTSAPTQNHGFLEEKRKCREGGGCALVGEIACRRGSGITKEAC